MPNTSTILAYAQIGQYLAANQYSKRQLLQGGSNSPLKRLSRFIYIVRKSVEFVYLKDNTDSTLIATGNYLYWLVGIYNAQAANIISGGGSGTIINPNTGTASTITGYLSQFTVGDVGAPMVAGETELVINLTDWVNLTFKAYLDGIRTPQNVMTQISYTIAYNPTNVTFTFNQGVQNGQLYIIEGLRLQAVAPPAASETYLEVATYAQMQALAVGNYFLSFLVLNDENKGQTNTRYEYWPDSGIREWLAAVEDI